jgi:hypothetical protein
MLLDYTDTGREVVECLTKSKGGREGKGRQTRENSLE